MTLLLFVICLSFFSILFIYHFSLGADHFPLHFVKITDKEIFPIISKFRKQYIYLLLGASNKAEFSFVPVQTEQDWILKAHRITEAFLSDFLPNLQKLLPNH